MTWALTIISLAGNALNCLRIKWCFIIWIACNIGWIAIDVTAGTYSRAVLDAVQVCFSVFGFIKWSETHGATTERDR